MEPTVGGRDTASGPHGWVYGVLVKGNLPAFLFSERYCGYSALIFCFCRGAPSACLPYSTERLAAHEGLQVVDELIG